MTDADLQKAISHYRSLAPRYDYFTRRINHVRQRAIAALELQPGEAVLDAGCGTGYGFEFIEQKIGTAGRLAAFDPSPDMIAVARQRISQEGWGNVTLMNAAAENIVLPFKPDAILFSYTHDIMRSRKALANLFAQARPGTRVSVAGTKLYAKWLIPANVYLRYSHRAYITNFDGLEHPWSVLAEYLDDFRVEAGAFSQCYLASGWLRTVPERAV